MANKDEDKPKAIKGDPKRKHGTWGDSKPTKGYKAKHSAKPDLKIVKDDDKK